jgi:predicted membrane-bound mannosyltransferase
LRPLSPAEAADAFGALRLAQGGSVAATSASPLIFALNGWTFDLLGVGDMAARFWPALAGALLPLFVFPLRGRLGRAGALAAAALLALSPHLVFFSRYLSGDTAVALAALVVLVALVRGHDDEDP